jgi:hypothetical protein
MKLLLAVAASVALVMAGPAAHEVKQYPLEAATGLRLHNVAAGPAVLQGKKGLRVRSPRRRCGGCRV